MPFTYATCNCMRNLIDGYLSFSHVWKKLKKVVLYQPIEMGAAFLFCHDAACVMK